MAVRVPRTFIPGTVVWQTHSRALLQEVVFDTCSPSFAPLRLICITYRVFVLQLAVCACHRTHQSTAIRKHIGTHIKCLHNSSIISPRLRRRLRCIAECWATIGKYSRISPEQDEMQSICVVSNPLVAHT